MEFIVIIFEINLDLHKPPASGCSYYRLLFSCPICRLICFGCLPRSLTRRRDLLFFKLSFLNLIKENIYVNDAEIAALTKLNETLTIPKGHEYRTSNGVLQNT